MATFSTVATTGDAAAGYFKYIGGVAVDTKIYFVPFNQNNFAIVD